MANNGLNTNEEADMSVDESENVVTMMDVLQEQEKFEEDANAVLGASDDKNCTYNKGYVKRQAIYACLTCCPDAKTDPSKRAGVCLACCLNCHENHELVELYTKRNFRCDCGNPKFNSHPCQFTPNKSDLNYDNKYNQNFSGIYCVCHRPYPDPEATEEEEMIQCIVCEDWLHEKHLDATVPYNDQYAEMICKDCMDENDFLHDYSDLVINTTDMLVIPTDPDLDVDITSINTSNGDSNNDLPNDDTDTKEPSHNQCDEEQNKEEEQKVTPNVEVDEKIQDTEQNNINNENKESNDDMPVQDSEKANDEEAEKDNSASECKTDDTTKLNSEGQEKTEEEKLLQDDIEHKDEASKLNEIADETEKTNGDENETKKTNGDETSENQNSIEEPNNSLQEDGTTNEKIDDNVENEDKNNDNQDITKETVEESISNATEENKNDITNNIVMEDTNGDIKDNTSKETKRKLSTEEIDDNKAPKKAKIAEKCVRQRRVKRVYKGATFWPDTLRQKLCTCSECISMYKDLAVLFLVDQNDTVTAYEALGKEITEGGPSSQYERGLQALSSLDRVQKINAMTEYNKMKDKLLDFLKSFKDRKEIVKEEDIKAFFAGLKPKREPDGVYFCR